MTTDRQLLEAAARAARIEVHDWRENYLGEPFGWLGKAKQYEICWNPLTDSGDALELAVRLNITVGFDALPDGAIAYTSAEWHDGWDAGYRIMEWLNKDPLAATRRAIVRAAAAMEPRT
jgi:hypothetical protein